MSNILVNADGTLKIADFGLAKIFRRQNDNGFTLEEINATNRVVTLWTRSPELVLGTTNYGSEIDMWSMGCILYELLVKQAPFYGINELSICAHFRDFFSPADIQYLMEKEYPWSFMLYSCMYYQDISRKARKQREIICLEEHERQIILGLLNVNEKSRLTAKQCSDHVYFNPIPDKIQFDDSIDFHEQKVKSEKNKRKKNKS
jgi:CTD kinase subunit alpha